MLSRGRFFGSRLSQSRVINSRLSPVSNGEYVAPPFRVSLTGLDGSVARVGSTIGYTTTWNDPVVTVTGQQWRSDGIEIPGETGATIAVGAGIDVTTLSVVVTTTEYGARSSSGAAVKRVAPTVIGSVANQTLVLLGTEVGRGSMADKFDGDDLTIQVIGYDGAFLNESGALRIDPNEAAAGQVVTVQASNSGGSASFTFELNVTALAFTSATFTGSGKIGSVHTAAATANFAATFSYDYERDGVSIGAPDQTTYTPVDADDLTDLSVAITASFDGVSISTEPAAISITYVAPSTNGSIPNQTYTQNAAIAPLDVSGYFTGQNLSFALAPSSAALAAGLSISSAGVLSGTPTALAVGAIIVVRGTNSGGYVDRAFELTVSAASAGNELTWNAEPLTWNGDPFIFTPTV